MGLVAHAAVTVAGLIASGVVFGYDAAGVLRVRAPSSLRETISAEVARRALRLRQLPPTTGARWGECDCCGESIEAHRGGMCWLCVAGRRKACVA